MPDSNVELEYDLWFACDDNGQLWFTKTRAGTGPIGVAHMASTVGHVYRWMQRQEKKIANVGICSLERMTS